MNLSRLEQETIVNYNAVEQTDIDKTYEMPKSLVNFRKPMRISEAQRAAAGERMKRLNNSTENT